MTVFLKEEEEREESGRLRRPLSSLYHHLVTVILTEGKNPG